MTSSSTDDASYCSNEVRSYAERRRTSRGRARVLPRRFADSVLIDPGNKERPNSETLDPDFGDGGRNLTPKPVALYEREEKELYLACRNFNMDKYFSTSRSTLTEEGNCNEGRNVVNEQEWQNCNFEEVEEKEEFADGDVVWAQLGAKYPAWPAIVINSMQESSELELDLCVPGSILVMFFGYFASGNKRVKQFKSQVVCFC